MWLIAIISSVILIAPQEEWLIESSIPVEYEMPSSQEVTQNSSHEKEKLKPQNAYSKKLKAKKISKRAPKSIK